MEKLLVLPATRSKLEALKAILAALKIEFKSIPSELSSTGIITDADLIKRIDAYEQGKSKTEEHTLEEIKAMLHA